MKTQQIVIGFSLAFATAATIVACSADNRAAGIAGDPVLQQQTMGTVHVCSSCHGLDGNSVSPTFPKLAGQQVEYLKAQLVAFRDHTRADPHAHTYMWGMAAHLSDAQIAALAGYFAGQKTSSGAAGDAADMAAGKRLYSDGDPDHDVPACQSCHGANGEGLDAFPKLTGQHREYLTEQLSLFRSNVRENEIMHANTLHLNANQARQLATYLAAQ